MKKIKKIQLIKKKIYQKIDIKIVKILNKEQLMIIKIKKLI